MSLTGVGGRSLLAGDFCILNRPQAGSYLGSVGINFKAIWTELFRLRPRAARVQPV